MVRILFFAPVLPLAIHHRAIGQSVPFFRSVPGFSVNSISADGEVAVGDVSGFAAAWTPGGGVVALPTSGFAVPAISASAISVSWDGTIISGRVSTDIQRPCFWNVNRFCSFFFESGNSDGIRGQEAHAVSGNAQAVIFNANDPSVPVAHRLKRWTSAGVENLPVQSGWNSVTATACSFDGATIVGVLAAPNAYAFRWTQSTGYVVLPMIPGTPTTAAHVDTSWACDASGSVIVGQMVSGAHPYEAFRWTPSEGTVGLGTLLPGDSRSVAMGVSADGRIVVGGSGNEAFIWDAHHGMRRLRDVVLAQLGINTGSLSKAFAVSADGRTIGGNGYILRLRAPCAGDVDDGSGSGGRDGGVTVDDLTFFLQHLLDGDTLADLNDGSGTGRPDGAVTIDDLLYFLGGYLGGC